MACPLPCHGRGYASESTYPGCFGTYKEQRFPQQRGCEHAGSGTLCTGSQVFEPSELEEIKEVMRMTLLGEMLVEEGRFQGLTEGHAAMVTEIIRRKLAKGFSPESIAELLELDPAYIKKIYTMIQDNPNETDLQIAQALIKGK